jgi:hypothetical protein
MGQAAAVEAETAAVPAAIVAARLRWQVWARWSRCIYLEEPVRVASPTRINLEEPVRVASPTRINSFLCLTVSLSVRAKRGIE